MFFMNARVNQVNSGNLLVINTSSNDEVIVHFPRSDRFSAGDHIRITYDGRVTLSIPPQISAIAIHPNRRPAPPPPRPVLSETRAAVIQRGRGFLLVRGLRDNRRMRVNYAHANHFCVGQRIIIRHDSITMNNPPEVTAADITPIC